MIKNREVNMQEYIILMKSILIMSLIVLDFILMIFICCLIIEKTMNMLFNIKNFIEKRTK